MESTYEKLSAKFGSSRRVDCLECYIINSIKALPKNHCSRRICCLSSYIFYSNHILLEIDTDLNHIQVVHVLLAFGAVGKKTFQC